MSFYSGYVEWWRGCYIICSCACSAGCWPRELCSTYSSSKCLALKKFQLGILLHLDGVSSLIDTNYTFTSVSMNDLIHTIPFRWLGVPLLIVGVTAAVRPEQYGVPHTQYVN